MEGGGELGGSSSLKFQVVWSGKITYDKAFQKRVFRELECRKIWDATERRDSVLKCRKMLFRAGGLVKTLWEFLVLP